MSVPAMKQALEALELGRDAAFQAAEMFHLEMRGYMQQRHEALDAEVKQIDEAITALRSAIEVAEKQEPVAWGNLANWCLDSDRVLITDKTEAEKYHRDVYDLTPLYTIPPAAPVQEPVAWPHKWGCRANAFGECSMGCTVQQPTQQPLTPEVYAAIAHRIASRYSHRTDPTHIAYTFLPNTLEQFVRAIEATHGITKGNT